MNEVAVKINPYNMVNEFTINGKGISPYSELNNFVKRPFLSWAYALFPNKTHKKHLFAILYIVKNYIINFLYYQEITL